MPISRALVSNLQDSLLHSDRAVSIRQDIFAKCYDAVLHFRVSDTNDLSKINYRSILGVCQPYTKVLVITNNSDKASSILTSRQFSFLSKQESLTTDLMYMVNSKVLICSSSTLSWWASEVSQAHQIIHFPDYKSLSANFNPSSTKSRIFYKPS